ncbi:MAG: SLC13 family permease [Alphaproteobacteria bacterium]|nr:SLC13 family permease [Alphaproteobacteria bacterium]
MGALVGKANGWSRLMEPRRAVMVLITLGAVLLLVNPPPAMPLEMAMAGALILMTIGLLATGTLAEQLVALVFFLFAMILSVSPPQVVFSGFTSGAFWLVFGGLVIGAAVDRTGLGARIAGAITRRVGGDYGTVIGAIILVNMVLVFLMPSTLSRVVMLIPVVMALAQRLGYEAGGKQRAGMVMATVLSAYLCSTSVLPANVPNNVLLGAAEAFQGVQVRYFDYLVLHFPVLAVLRALTIWACIVWLFRPAGGAAVQAAPSPATSGQGVFTADEGRLAVLLAIALVLWATDSLHGVAPAWVSLGVGLVCLLPILTLVPPEIFRAKVHVGPLLYVAGIIGIGAVVSESGLGAFLSHWMLDVLALAPDAPLHAFLSLSGLAMLLGLFSTMPGVPAILVPIAGELKAASGLTMDAVLMAQVIGFSTVWFPYQVPPIIVGMQLGGVALGDGLKATVSTAVVGVVLLLPLDVVWWRLLGYLPDGVLW